MASGQEICKLWSKSGGEPTAAADVVIREGEGAPIGIYHLVCIKVKAADPDWSEEKAKKGMEDIHLSDLGAPSHPMEASIENVEQASDQGKQKEKGIKNDDMEPPMKNLDEDFDNSFNKRSKHHSMKAMGSREPEEPRAFTDEDSHDESFRKQQEVVDAAIKLMRHDEPTDTRDGQLVYIERVAGVVKLERDGRIEKCYEDSLAGILGTTQGTSYLKHDMIF
ncbi:hypothetical protein D1007_00259 [Hordeum vulgare]|nr:hypothetical protein D1007_00259 [Hordeum vulgare]